MSIFDCIDNLAKSAGFNCEDDSFILQLEDGSSDIESSSTQYIDMRGPPVTSFFSSNSSSE